MLSSTDHAHEIADTLTESLISATPSRMGRKKQWDARVNVTLTKALKDKIALALGPNEVALDLIREAIDRELKRRERPKATPKP